MGKLHNYIGAHLWKGVLSDGVVLYAVMSQCPNKTIFIKTDESVCQLPVLDEAQMMQASDTDGSRPPSQFLVFCLYCFHP